MPKPHNSRVPACGLPNICSSPEWHRPHAAHLFILGSQRRPRSRHRPLRCLQLQLHLPSVRLRKGELGGHLHRAHREGVLLVFTRHMASKQLHAAFRCQARLSTAASQALPAIRSQHRCTTLKAAASMQSSRPLAQAPPSLCSHPWPAAAQSSPAAGCIAQGLPAQSRQPGPRALLP